MSPLTIRLFGPPEIELSGRPLETDRRKAVALLAYLAVTGVAHSRDALAAMFWPDFDTSRAYAYLRRTLWELGQALGEGELPNGGWVLAERDLLRMDPKADLRVDVIQFQELVKKGRGREAATYLSEAAALYRGDFMAGFTLRDSPDFDAWQVGQSEGLRRQLSETLAALSRACAAMGETDAAVAHARRWLALDNLNEAAHRLLMELYAQAGQRSAALHQYETCVRLLQAELNVRPEPATQRLYDSIRRGQLFSVPQGGVTGAPVAVAAASASETTTPTAVTLRPEGSAAPAVQMPRPGTPFVGREKELAEITRLLADPDCRLLTLVGPGGAGKTRLALQIAGSLGAVFPGGVVFVPLAPVSSPELVVRAVAAALQFKFKELSNVTNERDPLQTPGYQLLDYLREKELLLLLDNFEHVIPAAGLVSDILAAAPGVKVLATSRERLNLAEEWALAVAGMAFPEEERGAPQEYGAVRLFVQVARQVQVGFETADADWRAMAHICRLVEGMPLAIEIAASWVRVLSVSEIATEIERSLDFLTTARPGVPERHRNLRAVFEHSWTLLSESERAAFCKLSIFHGGFTREAAAQVAGASLKLLLALADKSLVRRSPDGRFDLHEVLKRYAAEKLDEAPRQKADTQEAYHHYYLAMLQDLADGLKGPAQRETLDRLELEYDNLRAAWLLTAEIGDLAELELGLMALCVIHDFGQHYRQVGELLGPVLKRLRPQVQAENQDVPLFISALALSLSLLILYNSRSLENSALAEGAYLEVIDLLPRLGPGLARAYVLKNIDFGAFTMPPEQVVQNYQECSRIFKEAGDAWGVTATILTYASTEQLEKGRLEQFRSLGEQALASSQAIGSRWGMALSYHFLALGAFWASEYDKGLDYGQLAHDLYLEFKDRWRAMEAQVQIGRIETDLGRYDTACCHFEENLQFAEEMGARYFVALNQDCLGYVELLRGNLELAAQYYRKSLEVYRQLQNNHGQGMSLGNLGDVAMQQDDPVAARQYYTDSLTALLRDGDALWGQSVAYKKLGRLELLSGNYAEAARNLERALTISTEIRRESDIQEVLVLLGQLKFKTGAPQEGRALLEQVLASPTATPPVRAAALDLLDHMF